jgi:hypothetical protein
MEHHMPPSSVSESVSPSLLVLSSPVLLTHNDHQSTIKNHHGGCMGVRWHGASKGHDFGAQERASLQAAHSIGQHGSATATVQQVNAGKCDVVPIYCREVGTDTIGELDCCEVDSAAHVLCGGSHHFAHNVDCIFD